MLPLREGVMLGLWSRRNVEPAAAGQAGASEVAFTVEDTAALIDAANNTVPLSIARREDIDEIRRMAKGRFMPVA